MDTEVDREQLGIIKEANIRGAADLVVEILLLPAGRPRDRGASPGARSCAYWEGKSLPPGERSSTPVSLLLNRRGPGTSNARGKRLLEHCRARGYQVVTVIAEQGSGLNEKRKSLHRILRLAREGKMDLVVVEFKDRLARFGFTYIEQYLNSFGVKVEMVNGEVPNSLQEELAQDMLSIPTVFSAKLYGARSKEFRQKVKEAMAGAAEGQ